MKIEIKATVNAPINKVWASWTSPEHITKWNFASEDWLCPTANNDFVVGGRFSYRMEAKDGSIGFDFEGRYTVIDIFKTIEFELDDKRMVLVHFADEQEQTKISERFEVEDKNSGEMQRQGWQSILNNFKKYVESL